MGGGVHPIRLSVGRRAFELPLGRQVEMWSRQLAGEFWKSQVRSGLYLGILSKKMGIRYSAWPRVSLQ